MIENNGMNSVKDGIIPWDGGVLAYRLKYDERVFARFVIKNQFT